MNINNVKHLKKVKQEIHACRMSSKKIVGLVCVNKKEEIEPFFIEEYYKILSIKIKYTKTKIN